MIRSWLSFTAESGNPTKKNLMPLELFTSMVTMVASIPCKAAAYTLTSITLSLVRYFLRFLAAFSLSLSSLINPLTLVINSFPLTFLAMMRLFLSKSKLKGNSCTP